MTKISGNFAYRIVTAFFAFLTLGFAALWEIASIPCEQYESLIHAAISKLVFENSIPFNIHPHGLHMAANYLHNYVGWSWAFFIIQSFFWLIYVAAIYICATKLFSEKIGFWASIAFISSAHSHTALHTFVLDHPLGALIMLQIACYVLSERFSKILPSVFFILLIPACFFTKYSYIMYALPLLGTGFLDILLHKKERRIKAAAIYVFSSLTAAGIIWLILSKTGNDQVLFRYASSNTSNFLPEIHNLNALYQFSVSYILAFVAEIKLKQLQPIAFWLAVIGLFKVFANKELRANLMIIWLPIIFLELFINLFTYDDNRYYYPFLGGLFIIAVFWLEKLKYVSALPIIIIGLSGLITSAGWLYNFSPAVDARKLSFDLSDIKFARTFINGFEVDDDRRKFKDIQLIINGQSGWSESLFFTFEPRCFNAKPASAIACLVPEGQKILVREYPGREAMLTFQNASEVFAYLIWQDGMDKRYYMMADKYNNDAIKQAHYSFILHSVKETKKMPDVFDNLEEPMIARAACENCVFELYKMKDKSQ
ncbi:MAG: hypothetical protein K6G50_11330 [bacterium]|nr:hypothetical protein [bacterium]